jgi:hypothetical protein
MLIIYKLLLLPSAITQNDQILCVFTNLYVDITMSELLSASKNNFYFYHDIISKLKGKADSRACFLLFP